MPPASQVLAGLAALREQQALEGGGGDEGGWGDDEEGFDPAGEGVEWVWWRAGGTGDAASASGDAQGVAAGPMMQPQPDGSSEQGGAVGDVEQGGAPGAAAAGTEQPSGQAVAPRHAAGRRRRYSNSSPLI